VALFRGFLEQNKYWDSDAGWFLETNQPIISFVEAMTCKQYKLHRLFQRPV
jgi:hypothetical protein